MNKILKIFFGVYLLLLPMSVVFATGDGGDGSVTVPGRYESELLESIDPKLQERLDAAPTNSPSGGGVSVAEFVFKMLDKIVIPLAISVGIVMGIIGAYKLLFSSDEKQSSVGLKMVVYGIIGVIIMFSAKYIGTVLFEDIFRSGSVDAISGIDLSKDLYDKIAYPFIKIALYLALMVIFVILVGKSISLITKSDGTSHKKALGMIGWCAVSLLIIIGAKNIVEAIYGKQEDVFRSVGNLGDIGSGILADKNIPIIYNIITWVLSIVSLVIFLLLLVQGFKILINPSKAENFQKLGRNLLYTVIGLFVIGIGYLLTNLFILN